MMLPQSTLWTVTMTASTEVAWLRAAHRIMHRLDLFCHTDDLTALSHGAHDELEQATLRVDSINPQAQAPNNAKRKPDEGAQQAGAGKRRTNNPWAGKPAECGIQGHYGHSKAECRTLARQAKDAKSSANAPSK